DRQDGGQHVLRRADAFSRIHELAEHEKEDQREDVVEEDDDALAKGKLHLGFQESEIDADHEGSSVCSPVSLRNRSSSVGLETSMSAIRFPVLSKYRTSSDMVSAGFVTFKMYVPSLCSTPTTPARDESLSMVAGVAVLKRTSDCRLSPVARS